MADENEFDGLRERLTRQGEDALGKLAQDLLSNPLVSSAITRAFDAREKAVQAQEVAFNALNLPSAADIERLTRRVRSVSQRLEGIEDALDRLEVRIDSMVAPTASGDPGRVAAVEARLDEIAAGIAALRSTLGPEQEPPPRAQERLAVSEAGAAPKAS